MATPRDTSGQGIVPSSDTLATTEAGSQQLPPSYLQPLDLEAPLHHAGFNGNAAFLEADLWNPNILSTTNWLDAIVDIDYPEVPFDFGFSNDLAPVRQHDAETTSHTWAGLSSWIGSEHDTRTAVQLLENSPHAVASTLSGPSQISSTESAADICATQEVFRNKAGEYYVDGKAARLPRTKRRKLSSKHAARPFQAHLQTRFSLQAPPIHTDWQHRIAIPNGAYETLMEAWQYCCLDNVSLWPAFERTDFPPQELFEHLVGLYFASFHRVLPFLHPTSFDADQTHWMLILAMAAIGAHYTEDGIVQILVSSLQELLRRCLFCAEEGSRWALPDALTFAQVRILHAVGLMYSGDKRHTKCGLALQQTLANDHGIISGRLRTVLAQDSQWSGWVRQEMTTRTAYCIWLVDCMSAYHFQRHPLLALKDASLPLPCHEKLWSAASAEEWKKLWSSKSITPSLQEALQEIYIDKRLPIERGELARILMIHGLFQRSWEVEQYYTNPLSQWEPTAKKESSVDTLPSNPVWLPSVQTYTKWQNSVCDCLDILHWQANATIGQASGLEHPTVGFLHLARVVLLSPINSIVRLAQALTAGVPGHTADVTNDKNLIQRWAVQGQYKARLAAVHAGVTLWHVRRYSLDGFYEAPAVALAALMLWALGTFSIKPSSARQSSKNSAQPDQSTRDTSESQDEAGDDSACGIILLDRPTDDELVQQFIRKGNTMRAHITGVGDLFGPKGPERVLVEGCKLLDSLNRWGVAGGWLELVQRLGETVKRQQ